VGLAVFYNITSNTCQSSLPYPPLVVYRFAHQGMDFLLFLGTPAVIILASIVAAIGVLLGKWIKRMREG